MAGNTVYTVFLSRATQDAVYQFWTTPIQARVRPKSRPGDNSAYLLLKPKFMVRDFGAAALLSQNKLVAIERSIAGDQKSVSFRISTSGSTTVADFRALEKAKKVGLDVTLEVQASMRLDGGNLMPMVFAPPAPLMKRFYADLRFDYNDMDLIMWQMYPVVQEKIKLGYFIANPDPVRAVWNTYVEPSAKGGVCGDFQGWGIEWSRTFIDELFGPGSILTYIHVGAPGAEQKLSHVATLAILPNGARYVLDYWMSVKLQRPCVFESAADWRYQATKQVAELRWAAADPGMLNLFYGPEMDRLSGFVTELGETEGIKGYLAARPGADPVRAREIVATRDALVKSYRRAKW